MACVCVYGYACEQTQMRGYNRMHNMVGGVSVDVALAAPLPMPSLSPTMILSLSFIPFSHECGPETAEL